MPQMKLKIIPQKNGWIVMDCDALSTFVSPCSNVHSVITTLQMCPMVPRTLCFIFEELFWMKIHLVLVQG